MKKLFQNLQNNRAFFLFALLTGLAFSCASVVSPSISGKMITAFSSGAGTAGIWVAAYVASNIIQSLLSQADTFLTGRLEVRLKRAMRGSAFHGFLEKSPASREAASTFSSFVNNDVPSLVQQFFVGTIDILKCLALLALSAVSLVRIHWAMAIAITAVSLLIVAVPKWMGNGASAARKAYSQSLSRYNTVLASFLGGISVVRAYRYESRAESLLETENQSAAKSETGLVLRRTMVYGATAWLQITKTLLIFLMGLWLIHQNQIDMGGLVTTVQLAELIASPMEVLAYLLHSRNEARPLLEAYEQYIAPPVPSAKAAPGPFTRLRLEQVGYSAGDVPILRDATAEFLPGKKYLVTGESGSGKSTLLRLIAQAGMEDYAGRISYGPAEIRSLDPGMYRSSVCLVFQEPYLFHATLEENILLGRDLPREQYLAIIRKLNLEYLLERYQGQDLTPQVLEQLSGGERQRVALARAMAGRPRLYLLDEVTSALDEENARLVEDLLLQEEAAVIHICHKVSSEQAARYDGRYVMEKGVLRAQ